MKKGQSNSPKTETLSIHPLLAGRWARAGREGMRELGLRMLRLENALYQALEAAGHTVGTGQATVHGEHVSFRVREPNRVTRVPLTKKDWGFDPDHPQTRQELVPSGRPTILVRAYQYGSERRWNDRPGKPLEDQIGSIVRSFEAIAARKTAISAQMVTWKREHEIAERKAAQRYHKDLERERRAENLHDLVKQWHEAARLRAFLAALRQHFVEHPPGAALAEWMDWAEAYAASYDPMSEESMADLQHHAEIVAHEPIDDEEPDPEEMEWRSMGFLDEYLPE